MTPQELYACEQLGNRPEISLSHYLDVENAFKAGLDYAFSLVERVRSEMKFGNEITIDIKILDERIMEDGFMPSYSKPGDAGMDVRACIDMPICVEPGKVELIPLGFAMHIFNPGAAAILIPRSGLGHKNGIVLGNLVGLIDSEYQGQVFASVWNRGSEPYYISAMDKIAQMVIIPVIHANFNRVHDFEVVSERAEGGFGHTGKR